MSRLSWVIALLGITFLVTSCGGGKPKPRKYDPPAPVSTGSYGDWRYEEIPVNEEFDYYPLYY